MQWKQPPRIKIYEALGAIADNRIHTSNNEARVFSSSGNKYYTVRYDPQSQSITSNDNGSYWQGYLGYPAIAFLMQTGVLPCKQKYGDALQGIAWKDINQKYSNDFEQTITYCDQLLEAQGINLKEFYIYLDTLMHSIEDLQLTQLGDTMQPPKRY
jgi:hypothetical protein